MIIDFPEMPFSDDIVHLQQRLEDHLQENELMGAVLDLGRLISIDSYALQAFRNLIEFMTVSSLNVFVAGAHSYLAPLLVDSQLNLSKVSIVPSVSEAVVRLKRRMIRKEVPVRRLTDGTVSSLVLSDLIKGTSRTLDIPKVLEERNYSPLQGLLKGTEDAD